MEDLEYSVEVCDRDWQCFFAECEECDLPPPSLAGVDDSGMSDLDDAGSLLAKRAQRVDPAAAPTDCGGGSSPVARRLGECVLSGSEEDVHLQSVNLFFEGLKGLAEDERPSEPGKSGEGEGRRGGDGQPASGNTLPKNLPESNRLPAKGEAAVGSETLGPAGATRHTNIVRNDVRETKIPDESSPETAGVSINARSTNGATPRNRPAPEAETFPGRRGIEAFGADPTGNPGVEWKGSQTPPRSAPANQAWSPASVRKRRRRKRRLGEGGQLPAGTSDTDEERHPSPGRPCSPEDAASSRADEPQKSVIGSTRRTAAVSEETTDGGSATAPRRSDEVEECDCRSVSVPNKSDQITESQRAAGLQQANQNQPNGKSHWAEVRSVGPAHVGSGQNDRRSAAKSAVAAEAGNSGEPRQQLEGLCRNTGQDGGAGAPQIPHAEPKGGEPPSPQEVGSPLTGWSPKSEKTQAKQSDSQVDVLLTKSNREDILTSASDSAVVSSACSLESITSLSDATDLSTSFSSSLGEEKSPLDREEAEETVVSQPEKGQSSVFAISSFWSEMERLTINDILGLRMTSRASPAGCLPPLPELREADASDGTDRDVCGGRAESGSPDFPSPKSVMWESEAVPPSLATEDPPAVFFPARPRQGISKNVSVRNLHALESQTFGGVAETAERFEDGLSNRDGVVTSSPPSLADSYRFSLADVFQYLFRGKPSLPDQSAPDPTYSCGNSVPESYDHFFSEFDTESFFYPLMAPEDRAVPVFSCTRPASRNLQFPDAYDYFFKSSSSDDSDEEDGGGVGPVRVVTRFSRKASSPRLSTDIYEDFFTGGEDFFWKTTFSFRNLNLPSSAVRTRTLNPASLVPVRKSWTSHPRALHRLGVPGSQDGRFPDPLLVHLDERVSRRLVCSPFAPEDLQTVVSNPGLDAPLLPLGQADMCMVCIAFASWVLKTADPQVGDAWKAVLLANVSALSAIRFLRRFVRSEAATGETKPAES